MSANMPNDALKRMLLDRLSSESGKIETPIPPELLEAKFEIFLIDSNGKTATFVCPTTAIFEMMVQMGGIEINETMPYLTGNQENYVCLYVSASDEMTASLASSGTMHPVKIDFKSILFNAAMAPSLVVNDERYPITGTGIFMHGDDHMLLMDPIVANHYFELSLPELVTQRDAFRAQLGAERGLGRI